MEMTKGLLSILLTAILTQNFVLSQFLGICPFLGVSKKLNTAVGMSAAVIFVMALFTAVTYPINQLLVRCDLAYLQTIVFILVIASLVQMVGYFIKKTSPSLYKTLGIYLPLITTNCAVLGVVETNMTYDFGRSMANALGTSLGFVLVIFLFACIRVKLEGNDLPKAFKGVPIALIVAGIMAIVFMGLGGMVDLGSWGIA